MAPMFLSFYKKAKKSTKNKGGFTLVELMVTLVIAAICISLAITILLSGSTMAANQVDKDSNKNLANNIMEFMKEAIQYSSEEVLVSSSYPSSPLNPDYGVVYISNDGLALADQGFLFFKAKEDSTAPRNVFGLDFYNSKKIGSSITVIDDDTLQATVKVYDSKDVLVYQKTDSISLVKKTFDPSMPGISPTSGDFPRAFIEFK